MIQLYNVPDDQRRAHTTVVSNNPLYIIKKLKVWESRGFLPTKIRWQYSNKKWVVTVVRFK